MEEDNRQNDVEAEDLQRRIESLERMQRTNEDFRSKRNLLKLLTVGAGGIAVGYFAGSMEREGIRGKLRKCVGLLEKELDDKGEIVCVQSQNDTGGTDVFCAPKSIIRRVLERLRNGACLEEDVKKRKDKKIDLGDTI